MFNQLTLPGMAHPPEPSEDIFFLLRPDEHAKAAITDRGHAFMESHGLRGILVSEDRYHVTTLFLGDAHAFGENAMQNIFQAASAVASSTKDFPIVLDCIGGFGSKQRLSPLVLNQRQENPFFSQFVRDIHRELLYRGIRPQIAPSSKLHLTLCYREKFVESTPIVPIRWQATELVLIKSLFGKGQHIQLGKWPLKIPN